MGLHMLPLVGRKMHGATTGHDCIVHYVISSIRTAKTLGVMRCR